MPEGRPALVHDLRLFLRIKILADFTHDAQNFALPRLEQRGVFLHKIEQVFLRFSGKAACFGDRFSSSRFGSVRHSIFTGFVDTLPGFLSRFLFLQRDFLRALIAIDAVIHQRVAGVEQFFYFIHSVAFFTAGNVISGENQVIDDRAGIRPAPEEIIILKRSCGRNRRAP